MIVEVCNVFDYTVNQDNVLGQGLLFLRQKKKIYEKKSEQKAGQTGQVHTTDREPAGC